MMKKKKLMKGFALFMVANLMYEIAFPTMSYALTGGPSQPEVQSFEPVGTTEMVDVSSGDFNYNIPLLDVEGYPINISYHGGISMDQEASWVGLGWNINPGVINRNMRGLPDDFNGEKVEKYMNMAPNTSYGVTTNLGLQILGKESKKPDTNALGGTFSDPSKFRLNFTLGVSYNSYRGVGFELGISPSINAGVIAKTGLTYGLGFSANSQEGFGVEPTLSYSNKVGKNHGTEEDPVHSSLGVSVSAPFNSRTGLKKLTYGANASIVSDKRMKKGADDITNGIPLGQSSVSFGTSTYIPNISFPMETYNASFAATLGVAAGTTHPNGTLSGFIGEQKLKAPYSAKKAYGYLYTQNKAADMDVLLDFNREKDGAFSENTNNLPIANYTYDLYSVSGQGIGAMYRPHRSDIGFLYDDQMVSSSSSGSLGAEVGIAKDIHTGVDKGNNTTVSRSGVWAFGNKMTRALYAKDYRNSNQPLYEPAYFKNVGERTPVDSDFYAIFGNNLPVRVGLTSDMGAGSAYAVLSDNFIASDSLVSTWNTSTRLSTDAKNNVRQKRDKRNQMIQYLTAYDATFAGLDKTINSYLPADENGYRQKNTYLRMNNSHIATRRPSHLSEITALNPDGMRYVYGIPAYNVFTEEHTFNVGAPTISNADCASGLIQYTALMDSIKNDQGIDKFFSKTVTPQYAHSYLLTSVLSPDYVDVTGNGVTFDDDLGTAIKINYYLHDTDYQWRTPYGTIPYQCYYNEGQKTDNTDNKGSYIYGKKEIWYVSSVETKNYIAEFTFSSREDGLGVAGRHGGRNTNERLLKLDKITLYSRKDRELHGAYAVPVKTVYFEYDYSLCPNVENNSRTNVTKTGVAITTADTANPEINANYYKGKLTLKKIYFTYGKSKKAILSPYRFYYANYDTGNNQPDPDYNPSYNIKAYDRWGNYKPNPDIYNCGSYLSTADFPYVKQNKDSADMYTAAWSLTRIDLPSGGQIKVTYESDDYAYVQHKRAMQMCKVVGVGDVGYTVEGVPYYNFHRTDKLYEKRGDHFYYLFFHLQDGYNTANNIRDYFRDEFRQYPDLIYFNFLVDLKNAEQHYEYVRGYAQLVKKSNGEPECGVVEIGGTPTGFLKVQDCPIGDREKSNTRVSPFVKTAWQFARTQRPELVHPGSNTKTGSESAIRGLLGALTEVTTLFKTFNKTLQNKDYGKHFVAERSWIRLYNPSFKKLGGGARVKKLELSDRWKEMTGNAQVNSSSYGQEYEYTTTEKIAGTTKTISSGVASYEPSIGGEENPWKQPVYTNVENLAAPDEKYYTEAPYGETFFPAPTVIYSKVTVKNLAHANVKKHATGKVVHEFYTARDFPTIVAQTNIDKRRHKLNIPFPKEIEDYMTASQGYLIELNDMHGKPKAQWVYAEDNANSLSGVEYKYQVTDDNRYPYRLNNMVKAFDKDFNVIKNVSVATDIDFYVDSREHYTSSYSGTNELNLDFVSTPPVPFPMAWASYSSEKTRFRSISATKIINKFGILKKTIAYENGAKIETENVLYDAHTGEVLLTRTQNEFKDSVFSFTYPAHFAYEGMGQAYKNIGAVFNSASLSKYNISLSGSLNPADYFYPGDELLVVNAASTTFKHGWVHKTGWGSLFVIDSVGKTMEGTNLTLKILRSGRRNLQNTTIAHSVSLKNPVVGDSLKFSATTQILDAGASVFSDQWGKYCSSERICANSDDSIPIQLGNILSALALDGKLTPGTTKHSLNSFAVFMNSYFKSKIIDSIVCSNSDTNYYFRLKEVYRSGCTRNYVLEFYKGETCGISAGVNECFQLSVTLPANCGSDFSIVSIDDYTYTKTSSTSFTIEFTANLASGGPITFSGTFFCGNYTYYYCYCDTPIGKTLNPYLAGLRGTWRKKKDFLYLTERTYGTTSISARKNGYYTQFNPYWKFDALAKPWKSDSVNWTWSSEVTKYSPQGFEIENRDALNRYSAALYAANNLPVAVGSNARLKQIAYDGFEDLDYELAECKLEHWNFKNDMPVGVSIDTTVSHTGIRSMKVNAEVTHLAARKIFDCSAITPDTTGPEYKVQPCDCIDRFSPDTGYKYVLSGWIKDNIAATNVSYTEPSVIVELISGSGTSTLTFKPSGRIIEGWQRVDTTFFIPYGTIAINIKLKASEENATWFDDLRIHPFDGNLKSYVYDPVNLKLMAELDENNFATFYEYDEQGALIRVKKETERGIVTLKEARNSSFKLNP